METTNPIGIFDSGIGGITILQEVERQMPHEDIIYLSDDKNCPYGIKTNQEIVEISVQNTNHLIQLGAKVIVVACNTATMAAVATLREQFNIPIVAIEPAIKPASLASKSGIIGIIATKSSIESDHLKTLCKEHSLGNIIVTKAGVGLVAFVEDDQQDSPEAYILLKQYIDPMIENGIDHLVLGCTHYPFFKKHIAKIVQDKNITIVEPATAIAKQIKTVLEQTELACKCKKKGKITFISTSDMSFENNERIESRYEQYKKINK